MHIDRQTNRFFVDDVEQGIFVAFLSPYMSFAAVGRAPFRHHFKREAERLGVDNVTVVSDRARDLVGLNVDAAILGPFIDSFRVLERVGRGRCRPTDLEHAQRAYWHVRAFNRDAHKKTCACRSVCRLKVNR